MPGWQEMPAGIEDAVSQFADAQGAAGVAVAVSTGTGGATRARYLATVGQAAAGTPWSTDTRSGYRSITKSFVGTVVLQLVGEGKLGLDDPLARYVPAVADLQYDGVAAGGQITVREALEMRTGLPEFSGTQSFSDRLANDYTGAFTDEELLGFAFAQPLDFAPGSQYEYSNTNYVLLGEAIQAVTGSPWDQQVQSRVLGPLGLASVAYSGAEPPAAPVATPYQASDVGLESLAQVSPSLYGASGGYFGTIGDLLTWGRALGSGSLVTPALQQARLTPVSSPDTDDPGSPHYDGYGLAVGTIDGWWGHTGTGLGYESLTMYQPGTGLAVAILINTQLPNPNGPAVLFKQLEAGLADLG
jgi:D-alanyl-D-alanine carboxypeptidase